MAGVETNSQGVGASVRRNEDQRFLDGKGEYLADLQFPGMIEVAFLRSPVVYVRRHCHSNTLAWYGRAV